MRKGHFAIAAMIARINLTGTEGAVVMGGIYLIREDEGLVATPEQLRGKKQDLTSLVADYPSLLAGDQMDTASPR